MSGIPFDAINAPDGISMAIVDVAGLRVRLWQSGFRPVPVYNFDNLGTASPGKAPMGERWTERARSNPPACAVEDPHPGALNTGILCDGLRAIDIDVDNPTIAAGLQKLALLRFGDCPIRVRAGSPRCLMLYRAESGEPPKRSVSGTLGKVEVLGRGQQFVAFGVHPSGAHISWLTDAPGEIAFDELPVVDEDAITAFLTDAAKSIASRGETRQNYTGGASSSSHGLRADSLQVVTALHSIPNNGPTDWDQWNRIGMAIWAATGGSEAGRAAFHAWSEQHPSYDPDETNRRWDHYAISPPTQIGAGTLFHMARRDHQEGVQAGEAGECSDTAPGDEEAPSGASGSADTDNRGSGKTSGKGSNSADGALWFVNSDWDEAAIPRRPWIAPGIALRGSVTVVTGAGSAGKSMLMVAYALALALGRPFSQLKPQGCQKVISYNVEDDANEQRRRVSAALRQFGALPADLSGKLIMTGPTGVGTLIERNLAGQLVFTDAMKELERRLLDFNPDVLMLDPLAELHVEEENDNTALRAIIARFRALAVQYDMAVILLHHTRKGSAAAAGDPDSSRGASAIIGAARVVLTVCSMTDDEAKAVGVASDRRSYYFRVDGAKSNYAPLSSAEWFERSPYHLDNGDTVVAAVPWSPPVDVVTPETQAAIEAAIARGSLEGPWSPMLSCHARSVKALFAEHGISTVAGGKKMLAALLAAGFSIGKFKKPNRDKADGLRAPDGRPDNVTWLPDEEA